MKDRGKVHEMNTVKAKRWAAMVLSAFAFVALLAGCTNCHMIDIANGDMFSYSYAPWESPEGKEMAARARYYEWGSRTKYRKGTWHRVEITMFDAGEDCSQTNVLKRARYWIEGEKEDE